MTHESQYELLALSDEIFFSYTNILLKPNKIFI